MSVHGIVDWVAAVDGNGYLRRHGEQFAVIWTVFVDCLQSRYSRRR